jgi:hypothetical protein
VHPYCPTLADTGTLSPSIQRTKLAKFGRRGWTLPGYRPKHIS